MRPSWVEIDLGAIAANVRNLAQVVAPAELCAVVKADAYGHGDVPVALVAVENGAAMLAVALVEEAVRLREAGVDVPIMVLSQPLGRLRQKVTWAKGVCRWFQSRLVTAKVWPGVMRASSVWQSRMRPRH